MNMNDSSNTALQIIIGLIFTLSTIVTIALASDETFKDTNKPAGSS